MRLVITGGAGFIGSAACRRFVAEGHEVLNIDKLTYAANIRSLDSIKDRPNYAFEQTDICDKQRIREVVFGFRPDAILHLAAESHVDRSIADPSAFIQTNVVGTVGLLEVALDYWRAIDCDPSFRFHHVSTDEVYGDLPLDGGYFTEATAYRPSSPYSASKAASDFMVSSWFRTYGLPVIISNCSNNYGAFQNPEKLIPHMLVKALAGKPLPVYGTGSNVRDWLHVEDHVDALALLLARGRPGERYNVGGNNEWRNLDVVRSICRLLDESRPRPEGTSYAEQISFVTDRLGHDLRYAIDATKIQSEFNWTPSRSFDAGLRETVDWYLGNEWWWNEPT
ncbi:MAG: dTDP-glucose 4,6-dehydratase [Mesorhizobium sp.]|nr:dTDP-glucose 4,6-dehydratase [Mesorhizobium sp.]MBN9244835.1 dTDP-glucose 4,6-dehydratase [Mesorhizobium sp.]